MRIKPGVRIAGIKPELLFGLMVADSAYIRHAGHEVTVTSVKDGVHKVGSKHYTGNAADLRISDVTKEQADAIVESLKFQFEPDFDIVLEADHIHLEFDPK